MNVVSKYRKKIKKHLKKKAYAKIGTPSLYRIGSPDWFSAIEKHFGGIVSGVKRNHVSPHDPRDTEKLNEGGMTGGDRMFHHGYGEIYSKFLADFYGDRSLDYTVAEFGILRGTGLAIWSELFPEAKIYGFDIDPNHYLSNKEELRDRGAFAKSEPTILVFDQFLDDETVVERAIKDRQLDIVIDDGFHSDETIMNTICAVKPFLSNKFVYFIEDNATVFSKVEAAFPDAEVFSFGKMTVVTSR